MNNDVYCVYARDEPEAKEIFINHCEHYATVSRKKEYREYWEAIHDIVISKKLIITENFDFNGVRRILN